MFSNKFEKYIYIEVYSMSFYLFCFVLKSKIYINFKKCVYTYKNKVQVQFYEEQIIMKDLMQYSTVYK